ncbi:hypothetical protein CBL_09998 [Carabus blaptoides fortunei]
MLQVDNQCAINLAPNQVISERNKHIDLRHYFLVSTSEYPADMLTKNLTGKKTGTHSTGLELGILPLAFLCIFESFVFVRKYPEFFEHYDNYGHVTRQVQDIGTPRHNLSIFEANPIYLSSIIYNHLPRMIKQLNSIAIFKSKEKRFSQNTIFTLY